MGIAAAKVPSSSLDKISAEWLEEEIIRTNPLVAARLTARPVEEKPKPAAVDEPVLVIHAPEPPPPPPPSHRCLQWCPRPRLRRYPQWTRRRRWCHSLRLLNPLFQSFRRHHLSRKWATWLVAFSCRSARPRVPVTVTAAATVARTRVRRSVSAPASRHNAAIIVAHLGLMVGPASSAVAMDAPCPSQHRPSLPLRSSQKSRSPPMPKSLPSSRPLSCARWPRL